MMPSRYAGPAIFCSENDEFFEDELHFSKRWPKLNDSQTEEMTHVHSEEIEKQPQHPMSLVESPRPLSSYKIEPDKNETLGIVQKKQPGPRKRLLLEYHCLLCNYKRNKKESVSAHTMTHFLNRVTFKVTKQICLHCPERIETPGEMVLHLKKAHHPDFSLMKISCNLCNEWYINQGKDDEKKIQEHQIEKHYYHFERYKREKSDYVIDNCEHSNLEQNFVEKTIEEVIVSSQNSKLEERVVKTTSTESIDSGVDSSSNMGPDLIKDSIESETFITAREIQTTSENDVVLDSSHPIAKELGYIFWKNNTTGGDKRVVPIADIGECFDMIQLKIGRSRDNNLCMWFSKSIAEEHFRIIMPNTCKAYLEVLASAEYHTKINGKNIFRVDPDVDFPKIPMLEQFKPNSRFKDLFRNCYLLENGSMIEAGTHKFRWEYAK